MLKHWKNLKYLIKHKYFVLRAGLRYRVWWHQLILHDWSKLTLKEWFGYTNKFHGSYLKQSQIESLYDPLEMNIPKSQEQVEEEFGQAWNQHQKMNKHHWNYWVLVNGVDKIKALEMPERFVREMIADWVGAGQVINGRNDVVTWWMCNRHKMILHPNTRELVHQLIIQNEKAYG